MEFYQEQMAIYQHLDLYDKPMCCMALTIILDYIVRRNQNLLEQIKPPVFLYDVSDNLVCANNSLEQLNIINISYAFSCFLSSEKSCPGQFSRPPKVIDFDPSPKPIKTKLKSTKPSKNDLPKHENLNIRKDQ